MALISPLTGRPMGSPLSQTAIDNVVAFFNKHNPKSKSGDDMEKQWWEGEKPIVDGGSDGQEYTQVFARKVGEQWEYVVVKFTNDGIKKEVLELSNGKGEESVFV